MFGYPFDYKEATAGNMMTDTNQRFYDGDLDDKTPMAVAATLILAGGAIFLLKQAGFRFNFGVAAGR